MFNFGKGAVGKHCYDVHVRKHVNDYEINTLNYPPRMSSLETCNQVFTTLLQNSYMQQITITGSGDKSAEIILRNAWYNIDTSDGSVTIDFTATGDGNAIGSDGEGNYNAQDYEPIKYSHNSNSVIVLKKTTSDANTVTITLSDSDTVTLHNENDVAVLKPTDLKGGQSITGHTDIGGEEVAFTVGDSSKFTVGEGVIICRVVDAAAYNDTFEVQSVDEDINTINVTLDYDANADLTNARAFPYEIWGLWFYANLGDISSIASPFYTKIGAIAESPTINTSEGDTVSLGDCTDKVISENIESGVEVLEVTDNNLSFLKNLSITDETIDIAFVDTRSDALDVILNSKMEGSWDAGLAESWHGSASSYEQSVGTSPEGTDCQLVKNKAGYRGLVYQAGNVTYGAKVMIEFWAKNNKGEGGYITIHSYGRHSPVSATYITSENWRKYYIEFDNIDDDMILNFCAKYDALADENEILFWNVKMYDRPMNFIGIEDLTPSVQSAITGNDQNKVTLNSKKEVPNITTNFAVKNKSVPDGSKLVDHEVEELMT